MSAPTLYYPQLRDDWLLTKPSVLLERRFDNGATLFGGAGVVATFSEASFRAGPNGRPFLPYGGSPDARGANGIWNTLTVGGSLGIGAKTSGFLEGSLILDGIALAGEGWIGGVPFTCAAGVATAL